MNMAIWGQNINEKLPGKVDMDDFSWSFFICIKMIHAIASRA